MKFLITGGSGFIGRHLIKLILNSGHEVLNLCRSNEKLFLDENYEQKFYEIKLHNDLTIKRNSYDCFIDLAWEKVSDVNHPVHLGFNFPAHLDLIKKIKNFGIKNIFVLGSCYEYALFEGAISEQDISQPKTKYGLAKSCLYNELIELSHSNKINLIWGRLFYVYGSTQPERTLYGQLLRAIQLQAKTFTLSSKTKELDYLHVNDVVKIIYKLCLKNENVGAVNIASGYPINLTKFVKKIFDKNKVDIIINYKKAYSSDEPQKFWGDTSYLNRILSNE